jgi:nicotinate-nucleotide pyrophosphorylase (carboxylating)
MMQQHLNTFIREALEEDIRQGDITSLACISKSSRSSAKLLVKDTGMIAGVELAKIIFQYLDPEIEFNIFIEDGSYVKFGDVVFEVQGYTQDLLKGERLVLNTMQRMSGIATLSSRYAVEVEDLKTVILDTRKTTPLNRAIEKWAVRIGGCQNYRDGLFDRFMIKDNHIKACGGITKAVLAVRKYMISNKMEDYAITVEVRNLEELEELLICGQIHRIMLDNFELPLLQEAVDMIGGRFEIEASGGVHLETVRKIALTGVDFISVGALTHSAGSLDLSLKIKD